jgi:hypothetical protein
LAQTRWRATESNATNINTLHGHIEARALRFRTRASWQRPSGLISLRDMGRDVEREVELVYGHARSGLDFAIAKGVEDNAEHSRHVIDSSHRLNLIPATFLPITALGTLLGINLRSGLEGWNEPYLFWVVAGVAFVLGFAIRTSLPKPAR